jgi:hypothetical protein
MNLQRAVTAAAATCGPQGCRIYKRAVAHGAHNTQCTAQQESAYGALRLLTLTTLRLPDLMLYAHLLHVYGAEDDERRLPRPVVQGLSDVASGALRLAHRALETHAHAAHYDAASWIEWVVRHSCCELDAMASSETATAPILIEQARRATIALTRATAATASDPILAPEQIAAGLGHLLAVYLVASEAAGR